MSAARRGIDLGRNGLLLATIILGGACSGVVAFECAEDTQCTDGSLQGVCQPTGYCSFPDERCESGQRYGDRAPTGLARRCVPVGEATDGAADDGSTSDATHGSEAGTTSTNTAGTGDDPVSSDDAASGTQGLERATDELDDDGTTVAPTVYEVSFGERASADVQRVTVDTFLDANDSELNFGAHTDLHVHEWNESTTCLLRFDLSSIPASAQVLSAHLELWTEPDGALETGTVRGYRVLEDWDAGTLDYGSGVANWIDRKQGVPWTTDGARAGSHGEDVLFEFAPGQVDTAYEVQIPADVVQAWVQDPEQNHGVAFYSTGGSGGTAWVSSSLYWVDEHRPLLTVVYAD